MIRSHGTKVVLLGNTSEENTMTAPEGVASPSRWITRYLNTRYFDFPEWEYDREDTDRNVLRTISGQKKYLNQHAFASGEVPLDGATARWWILKKEGALSQNSGFIASSGHCAALHKNELYEMSSGRTSTALLQSFGVVFGYQQVVLYLEPHPQQGELLTDTARTRLLIDSLPLPWADWAAEFREKIPGEIVSHMEAVAAASEASDHKDSIKERLKQIQELFRFSRYRPRPEGRLTIDPDAFAPGGAAATDAARVRRASSSSEMKGGGTAGSVYSLFLAHDGVAGNEVKGDQFP
jgi:hypothetical protein